MWFQAQLTLMGPKTISDLNKRHLRILKDKEKTILAFSGFVIVDYDEGVVEKLQVNTTINAFSLFEILWTQVYSLKNLTVDVRQHLTEPLDILSRLNQDTEIP
jgi:hypothetical protein